MKPGKPLAYGKVGQADFIGLPGNPVSSFVLFELMVKPFILGMMGCKELPVTIQIPMGVDFSRKKSERKSVIPVLVRDNAVFPLEYHGSAHINAYSRANGMMIMEIGQTEIRKGEPANVRPL